MRPLRLKLEAFGPFAESQSVDFRGFRYSRLFLIQGPVGSGKTFLLDGICFALYGRSSGGERDRKGLRHVGAPEQKDTVVTLDFEVSGENYRIERRLVLEQGEFREDEVVLWRLPEVGEPSRRDVLSFSLSGVTGMISRMMGLTAEQFCQVAILPQGQFRRFLLSNGQERTQIISSMFASERYAKLQEGLLKARDEVKAQLEKAWGDREKLVTRYEEDGGDPRARLARSQEELAAVEHSCNEHQRRSQEWERSLEDATRYETLDRQREMSQRELELLESEQEKSEDALSRRLRQSLERFDEWREYGEEIEQITSELEDQRAQYEALKQDTNFLEEEVERARQLEEEKFALRRAFERLAEVMQEGEGLATLSEEVEAARGHLAELKKKRASLATEVKKSKLRVKRLETEIQRIEAAETRLEGVREEVSSWETREHEAKQRAIVEDALEQAQERAQRLIELTESIKLEIKETEAEVDKQKARADIQALETLAPLLKKGQPCPLCGAKRHANPFQGAPPEDAPDGDLPERLEELTGRLNHALNELAQTNERVARLEGRLEGLPPPREEDASEDYTDIIHRLRTTIKAVEARVAERESLMEELTAVKRDLVPNRKRLRKMRLLRERLKATLEAAQRTRKERQAKYFNLLSEVLALGVPDDPVAWSEALEAERERIAERLEELDSVEYTTERAELMAETFALQLAETRAAEHRRNQYQKKADALRAQLFSEFKLEFSNWEDLCFSLNRVAREVQFNNAEGSVLDKETLVKTVERQLRQSQELLASIPVPEMKTDQIRHALSHEREQIELKVGRRSSLQRQVDEGAADVERYDSIVEQIQAQERRFHHVGKLARLASGDNELNQTFHDWVLERFFGRVLASANERLETLAPGRFALSLEPGLEVKVLDYRAGTARSATTLSGGESFLASLALALGLGDVLQGEGGARDRLETLFIDEGFGYLDRQALDAALDCLENLRAEGRTVGLISHVGELRERIRAQIILARGEESARAGTPRIQVFAE